MVQVILDFLKTVNMDAVISFAGKGLLISLVLLVVVMVIASKLEENEIEA